MRETLEWISVKDKLPEIDLNHPYSRVYVICTDGTVVRQLVYTHNYYARTKKAMQPRFEELDGRLSRMEPTHWMPLPSPPTE